MMHCFYRVKASTFLFLLLLFVLPVQAQITITSDEVNFPIGSSIYWYSVWDTTGNGIPVNVGTSGGPQTWLFNENIYPGGEVGVVQVVDPASTPFGSHFSTADAAYLFQGDSTSFYEFFDLTSSQLDMPGFGTVTVDSSFTIDNIPPDKLVIFPATLGTSWSSNYSNHFNVAPGIEEVDSTTSQLTIDAWGTYVGSSGTYDCLRIRNDEMLINKLLVNGIPVSSDTSTYIEYTWIAEQVGMLATVTSLSGETNPNFTMASVITFSVPTTGIDEQQLSLPTRFELQQNYPNPFNPSTTIFFTLPATMNVQLTVYDLLGQKIATLVNGRLSSGEHQVTFKAADLPSGVYLYQLRGNGITQTRRMVLLK